MLAVPLCAIVVPRLFWYLTLSLLLCMGIYLILWYIAYALKMVVKGIKEL